MPTFANIVNIELPENVDGISLKEVYLNNKYLEDERVLYWEFHEQGGKQAVRWGKWKGLRLDVQEKGFHDEIELYDLAADPSELNNIAKENPEIVRFVKEIMEREHEISESFPFEFESVN